MEDLGLPYDSFFTGSDLRRKLKHGLKSGVRDYAVVLQGARRLGVLDRRLSQESLEVDSKVASRWIFSWRTWPCQFSVHVLWTTEGNRWTRYACRVGVEWMGDYALPMAEPFRLALCEVDR